MVWEEMNWGQSPSDAFHANPGSEMDRQAKTLRQCTGANKEGSSLLCVAGDGMGYCTDDTRESH
jgi:hypothetical protein